MLPQSWPHFTKPCKYLIFKRPMKNFDSWNKLKKGINAKEITAGIYFREREIWFCSLGINIGSEQDGMNKLFERPVLVFKKFTSTVFLAIPLTRSVKQGSWYFTLNDDSALVLNQLRVLDARRLTRKVSTLNESIFQEIRNKLLKVI